MEQLGVLDGDTNSAITDLYNVKKKRRIKKQKMYLNGNGVIVVG